MNDTAREPGARAYRMRARIGVQLCFGKCPENSYLFMGIAGKTRVGNFPWCFCYMFIYLCTDPFCLLRVVQGALNFIEVKRRISAD
jgi:hypothetical protein